MIRIGFIGAGKVGTLLGRHFGQRGFEVVGYYSLAAEDSRVAAKATGGSVFDQPTALLLACNWIFLTVTDDQLAAVWQAVRPSLVPGQVIFHCSGAKSVAVFTDLPSGVEACTLHPLLAVAAGDQPLDSIASTSFTFETTAAESGVLSALIPLKNPIAVIDGSQKSRYHAACVFFSNLVIGLAEIGTDLLEQCGLPQKFAADAWRALFLANAHSLVEKGPVAALTGPVERNDLTTVAAHLDALTGEQRELYRMLSRVLIETAAQKHPEKDYSEMERVLRDEKNSYDSAKTKNPRQ